MLGPKEAVTVTAQLAVLPPSFVVAVMVADPALTPVTAPFGDTVAIEALLLLHVTSLFVALAGVMAGVRVSVAPTARVVEVLFSDTPVTAMAVGGLL